MAYPYRQQIPQNIVFTPYFEDCIIETRPVRLEYVSITGKTYDYREELKKHGARWDPTKKSWTCSKYDTPKMFLPELPYNVCCRDVLVEADGTMRCTAGENGCKRRIEMDAKLCADAELKEKQKSQYKVKVTYDDYMPGGGRDEFDYERYFDSREKADNFAAQVPPIGKTMRYAYGHTKTTKSITVTDPISIPVNN